MLTYLAIAERLKPRWLVWENVPGVLSSNGGKDFGSFLGALGELGYEWAYRVLDAQWFGVAQRRRRVFVVAYLGKGNLAAKVLFESESVRRNPAPSREAGQGVATDAEECFGVNSRKGESVAETLLATDYKGPGHNRDHNFIAKPVIIDSAASPTLRNEMGDNQVAVAVDCYNKTIGDKSQSISSSASDINHTGGVINPADRMAVRRLTPRECERLQGFPDDHTLISWRGKPADQCPDGPRYKALGNSMAVPCMAWIGKRIDAVERSMK
jgi:DNA (cytosine-5)-methyltransferase 1